MNHLSEEDLILCYYGEQVHDRARAHLNSCPDCRQRYGELQRQLDVAQFEPVPDPGENFPEEVWRKIEWRLPEPSRGGWRSLFERRPLAVATAVACLFLAAFLVGRFSPGGPTRNLEISAEARDQILAAAVADHLEQSQLALVELLNAPAGAAVDLSAARNLAADLLAENRLYRQTADVRGDAVLATVLDELERVLLEISHSSPSVSLQEWQALRRTTDAEGVLFRIRVLDDKFRDAQAGRQARSTRVL